MDTARPCLTRELKEILDQPGEGCRWNIHRRVIEKEPKRTVCTPCRDKLINKYIRMAYLFANREWLRNRLFRRRLERDDLSQIALLGLTKCAARYNPNKGKLSTILPYWVKAELQSEVIHHGGAVCLPLWATRGGPIDDEHVKHAMADRVDLGKMPRSDEAGLRQVADRDGNPPREDYATIEQVVVRGVCTARERDILLMNTIQEKSHRQIAEEMHLTKERVRQLKHHALKKIREALAQRGISA
jgi:RNA polymerase sigma factor (sigma-70 family)